jgi:hypothetical protein
MQHKKDNYYLKKKYINIKRQSQNKHKRQKNIVFKKKTQA